MKLKKPPFFITENILNLSLDIAGKLGSISTLGLERPQINLRKSNQVRTIQSSLAIEGNTLSVEQITDLIDNIPVVGPQRDIQEVKNAIKVYSSVKECNCFSITSFKNSHKVLMTDLIDNPGSFRQSNVGIFTGNQVSHMAPPSKQVPRLMSELFMYLKTKDATALLIKACVFHYELEFIHPFLDGNGRMGRLWQQLILMAYNPVFEYIPIESLIKNNQTKYYEVLGSCDKRGDSTLFLEFMLQLIKEAVTEFYEGTIYSPQTKQERLEHAKKELKDNWFSRQDYMRLLKTVSSATASRDIVFAVDNKLLIKKGDKRTAQYKFH
tara:strand:- start:869 stop:1840 length:972 start_codon:yes stop_codon:yes gene_type:complete